MYNMHMSRKSIILLVLLFVFICLCVALYLYTENKNLTQSTAQKTAEQTQQDAVTKELNSLKLNPNTVINEQEVSKELNLLKTPTADTYTSNGSTDTQTASPSSAQVNKVSDQLNSLKASGKNLSSDEVLKMLNSLKKP